MRFLDPHECSPPQRWNPRLAARTIFQQGLLTAIVSVRNGLEGNDVSERSLAFGSAVSSVFSKAQIVQSPVPDQLFTSPLPRFTQPILIVLEAPATVKRVTVGSILAQYANHNAFSAAFPLVITSDDSYSREESLEMITDPQAKAQADFAHFAVHRLEIPKYDQVLAGFQAFLEQLKDGSLFDQSLLTSTTYT